MVTRRELFDLAHAAGHTDPALFQTPGGRFYVTCSCGWKSTTRRTETDALGAGVHHAMLIGKSVAQNGGVSRRNVSASA